MKHDNQTSSVTCIRFVLAGFLAPIVAAYCLVAFWAGLFPVIIGLMHSDDARMRGDFDAMGVCAEWVDGCVTFMIWPWRLWRKLWVSQNASAQTQPVKKPTDLKP